MIITFEGGEGVGKSTHSKLLCKHLEHKGLPCLSFREPGGSSFSELIRPIFFREGLDTMTELLMVLASRRENVKKMIEPGLAAGMIIIIDRFIDSTLVYQGLLGGLGADKVREIMEKTGTWVVPDLTFVLDVVPDHSLSRIVPGDKFENQGMDFHRRLRQGFLDLAREPRYLVINSDRPKEEVSRDVIARTEEFLMHRTGRAKPF
jgi:dTMP kinase